MTGKIIDLQKDVTSADVEVIMQLKEALREAERCEIASVHILLRRKDGVWRQLASGWRHGSTLIGLLTLCIHEVVSQQDE